MIQILAEANLLEPIDYSKLPNVEKNIDQRFQGLPYDPEDEFSVPKDWGTTGFVYRTDMVKEKPTAWKEFFDLAKGPYSGKVTVLDGIPEVVGSTLVMLGYSYNSEDEAELEEAKQQLIDLKPHLLAITSTEYKQLLTSGKAVMSLGWNGDARPWPPRSRPSTWWPRRAASSGWTRTPSRSGQRTRLRPTPGSTTCTTPRTTRSRRSTPTTARLSNASC